MRFFAITALAVFPALLAASPAGAPSALIPRSCGDTPAVGSDCTGVPGFCGADCDSFNTCYNGKVVYIGSCLGQGCVINNGQPMCQNQGGCPTC